VLIGAAHSLNMPLQNGSSIPTFTGTCQCHICNEAILGFEGLHFLLSWPMSNSYLSTAIPR